MRALVTGATGFIGRYLVQGLIASRHEVVALTRRRDFTFPHEVLVAQGDLVSGQNIDEKLFDSVDVVFHCAGELKRTECMRQLHVDGTNRLLDIANRVSESRSAPIHWVQLSSVGAYGPPLPKANIEREVTETSPEHPVGEYELTKTEADRLVKKAASSLTFSILRPSNVFGAGMPNQSLRAMIRVVGKGLFFFIGQRGAISTYVHVEDVVEALLRCGFNPSARGKIYNVSNDCLLEELMHGISVALGKGTPKLRFPEGLVRIISRGLEGKMGWPLSQTRIDALVCRTRYPATKIKQELDFMFSRSVPESIVDLVHEKT